METTTESTNALTLTDPVFGGVTLDFSWWYNAPGQPNAGWHTRMSGTGKCDRGPIGRTGTGISYDSLLFRIGVDVLGLGSDVDPVLLVALVERHLATVAKMNVMRAFDAQNEMN